MKLGQPHPHPSPPPEGEGSFFFYRGAQTSSFPLRGKVGMGVVLDIRFVRRSK